MAFWGNFYIGYNVLYEIIALKTNHLRCEATLRYKHHIFSSFPVLYILKSTNAML